MSATLLYASMLFPSVQLSWAGTLEGECQGVANLMEVIGAKGAAIAPGKPKTILNSS